MGKIHNAGHERMEGQDEFRVNARGADQRVFSRRIEALEQFRQCVARGEWCEVWEGTVGVNASQKIADFPGLT